MEAAFRKALLAWYRTAGRDLPWRRTTDPYAIWLSEIMLQQTRVAAVIPYYERFLRRFPTAQALAEAPEADVLHAWAGLGYYSRARHLQKAARQIAAQGTFPHTYDGIRELAGVGDYTAAAVASIAFGLPYAVLDGNVMRVLARIDNDPSDIGAGKTKARLQERAQRLLDTRKPGAFNQALMELGATLCLPRQPQCLLCPVSKHCQGLAAGTAAQLPVKLRIQRTRRVERTLLIIERNRRLLLWQRPPEAAKLRDFWELPDSEQLPAALAGRPIGVFRHAITDTLYRFHVVSASIAHVPGGYQWIPVSQLASLPVSTTSRKALRLFESHKSP